MKRYLDLTQPLSPKTPRSSDHPEVTFTPLRWFSRNGISTHEIHASLHSGTHIDTAAMYDPDGETVDQITVERLIGTALFVDCRLGNWSAITASYLEEHAAALQPEEILVLCTGHHAYYNDEENYILRAPGLDRSGVDWIVARSPKGVASDSPSPEHIFMRVRQWQTLRPDIFGGVEISAEAFPAHYAHKTLLPKGIIMIEGLGGPIEQLLGRKAHLLVLPMKYAGVEAAPARVVAVISDD